MNLLIVPILLFESFTYPIVNPLSKPLNIELYNDTWFDTPLQTSQPLFDYNYPTLAFPDDTLYPFTSVSNLHANTHIIPPSPVIDTSNTNTLSPPSTLVLSKSLSTSDVLFFIRYTPEDTLNSDGSLSRSIMWKYPF